MSRRKIVLGTACLHLLVLMVIALSWACAASSGPGRAYLWSMDTEAEASRFDNDNTGAKFVLTHKAVREGSGAVEVLPGGQSAETKLALDLDGERLALWSGNDALLLHVYIPEDRTVVPNMFFLGMADVTSGWNWLDGVFSKTEVRRGWNDIRYVLSDKMKNLAPNGRFKLYFAFAAINPDNSKTPLSQSFYIDGIWLEKAEAAPPSGQAAAGVGLGEYLWRMDDEDELKGYENDNTGAAFALDKARAFQGSHSVAVIPNGQAPETKLALDLAGQRLERWIGTKEVVLNVYLPPENEFNPTMFFLGMADVTDGWSWVGGVFSKTEVKPGWNQVSYVLADEMRNLSSSRKYKLYFAWAHVQEGGKKLPLKERFYIDGIRAGSARLSREDLLERAPEAVKQEVAGLIAMNDDALLDAVSRKTFDYFWHEANPKNGLIKDRSTRDSPCSIAAVGFGLTAIPTGIERGWITREAGYERTLTTLKTFIGGGVEGKNGFFYHFVDMQDGRRFGDSEISSIDTALLVAGAVFAGEYFKGTEVERLARKLYESVNWQWMMNDGETLSMGWKPEGGFLSARWNSFNESLLMYILAIGSSTYPIPAAAWDGIFRPVNDNYISLPQESLFVYQYPHAWVDFRNKEDRYANYWNNSVVATRMNRLFCVLRRFTYKTYDMDVWGLSACDGPAGYKAYGASEGNHDGTVAPYASIASLPFTPELSTAAMRSMLEKHGPLIWGKYGFVSGFNVDQNWYSDQFVGIDQGDILLMIENHRSGFVWKYFMQNAAVKLGMAKVGFKDREAAEYAVTPGYMAAFERIRMAPREKKAFAARAKTPVVIDGKLDEWRGLAFYVVDEEMNVPAGGLEKVDKRKQILNSRFYAQWDDHYLYLVADIADEVLVTNIAPGDRSAFYRTDSIEFYIDPGRAGSQAGIMKLAILPFDTAGNVQAIRHEDSKPGPVASTNPNIKVASARTDRGYIIEVAVPLVDLGVQGKPGVVLGFSHTIHNSNDKNAKIGQYVRTNMLAWNNLPEIWASPELWGELIFQ